MIGNCTLAATLGGRFTLTRQLVEAHLAGDLKRQTSGCGPFYHLAAESFPSSMQLFLK